jgi:molybdenum cofactor cytidylyltransferase
MVTAIVLAAGESRRMGRLKPLLPFGTRTVIETAVRSLKASPVDEILVVTGHQSGAIERTLESAPVRVVRNRDYRLGMLSSIQRGLAAAAPETDWFVFALADQPQLQPAVVASLLSAANAVPAAYIPTYGGRRGHPILIHARLRDEIANLDSGVGLRQLWEIHPDLVRLVPVQTDSILHDIDTPEDYARLLARQEE